MTRAHPRLPRWQRAALLAVALLLMASGIGWLALHYSIGAGAGELPHPLEAWLLRLHGLAAFGALFLLGVLAGAHIPTGWRMSGRHRRGPQRGTGVALCTLGALLALTGWLLYYFAPEPVRPVLGWVHAGIGAAMAVLGGVHQRRKSRHGVRA